MSSVRSWRDRFAFGLMIGWFYVSLHNSPAGVPRHALVLGALFPVVFLAGFHFAGWQVRAVARGRLDLRAAETLPNLVACALLVLASQSSRVEAEAAAEWDGRLPVFSILLAACAGARAHQLAALLCGRADGAAAQALRASGIAASAVGFLGATGMWIGFTPDGSRLLAHAALCAGAAIVSLCSLVSVGRPIPPAAGIALRRSIAARQRRRAAVVGVAASVAAATLVAGAVVTLAGQPHDVGVRLPAAFAAGLLLATAVGRERVARHSRLLVVAAVVAVLAFGLVEHGWIVGDPLGARLPLAFASGLLLVPVGVAAERARASGQAVVFVFAFVFAATLWTTGLVWPELAQGAVLLLVAAFVAIRRR